MSKTALQTLLDTYRSLAQNKREKGDHFERLTQVYLRDSARFAGRFSHVWLWSEFVRDSDYCNRDDQNKEHRFNGTDTGIDLVAQEAETGEYWAIQCKFYDSKLYKSDINSFFAESGKKPFTQRMLVITSDEISNHVLSTTQDQQIPCINITLSDFEESNIDWSQYQPNQQAVFKPKKTLRPHQEKALSAGV